MNSARLPVKLISGQMRGICCWQGTNWPSRPSFLSFISRFLYMNTWRCSQGWHRLTIVTNGPNCPERSNVNQSSFKRCFSCHDAASVRSILRGVNEASARPLMSLRFMTSSGSVINRHYRDGPQDVCYEPWQTKGGVVFFYANKGTHRPFFALLMSHNKGPPPGLQIHLDLVVLAHWSGKGKTQTWWQ